MTTLTRFSWLSRLERWQSGRPDRRLLLICTAAAAAASVMFALLPASALEAVLSLLAPSTSSRSVVRVAVLEHHRWVFGLLALGALGLLAALPPLLRGVSGVADALARLDKRSFLAGLIVFLILSRLLALPRLQPIIPGHDTGHYFQLANTLLDEGRYIEYASHPGEPDGFRAWRLPGYPAALALALAASGRWLGSIVVLNSLWMVVLVLAIYGLVRRLGSEAQARLAAVAVALYPLLLTASLETMSEVQYTALLVLSAYLLFSRPSSWWSLALAGLALGLAALTRGNGLLMFPILLLAYVVHSRGLRDREPGPTHGPGSAPAARALAARGAIFALCFAVTLAPWVLRNRAVLGSWVALATNGGVNMWIGHHPGGDGLLRPGRFPPMPEGLGEVEMSRYGMRESVKYWLADPVENVKIGARIATTILKVDKGALPLLFSDGSPRSGEGGRPLYLGLFGLFVGIYYAVWALVGFWTVAWIGGRWPPGSRAGLLVFIAVAHVATFVPFLGYARYKIPSIPFLVAAAAMVVAALASGSVARSEPRVGRLRLPRSRIAAASVRFRSRPASGTHTETLP